MSSDESIALNAIEEQLGAMSFLRSTPQENFTREEKIIFNDILRTIDTLVINE
jgi:hypothetical protein